MSIDNRNFISNIIGVFSKIWKVYCTFANNFYITHASKMKMFTVYTLVSFLLNISKIGCTRRSVLQRIIWTNHLLWTYQFMTDFKFVRLGLSYTSFSIPNATGKINNEPGFDQYKTGVDELKRVESRPFFSDLDELYTAIRLMITDPFKGFTLSSNIFVLQDFNTLQVQHPDCFNQFVFSGMRSTCCIE